MSPFRRSDGPGLSILVWCATSGADSCGEFLDELPVDCFGEVDLLLTTHRAVVMEAEIRTSAEDIPTAKKQLIRRFKIVAMCLEAMHNINAEERIFLLTGSHVYRC
eukprot:gene25840-31207_t